MLLNLHVKNLALIDEIEVDFKEGLNILTGETGAGKSIILGSIHLALGGRYSKDMIRKGAQFGLVELIFSIDQPAVETALATLDIFPENGQIVLCRKLMEGRSISRINGETVNMATLRNAASILIDIHGQHDHESLLNKKKHISILDAFAGKEIKTVKEAVAKDYHSYQSCKKKLMDETLDETEKQRELSLLQYEINEIEDADLKPGEDEVLEEQYKRMVGGKKAAESAGEAYQYTGAGEGASDALSRAVRALAAVSDFDQKGKELYEQLMEVDSLLNDFNRELSEYEKSFDFSEEEFYETEERLNQINYLKSKYGQQLEEVLGYYEKQCERLAEIQDYDAYIDNLNQKLLAAEQILQKDCEKLSKLRKKYAKQFVEKIKQGLIELNFLEVQFEMRFQDAENFSSNGRDTAQFYVSTNPGEELHPLNEVASGGELSRIMLAIKAAMADKEDTPTLIFDEIDTGISGITAGKVAAQMALIARTHQVICITHLPQIAAQADIHFSIEKNAERGHTQTAIRRLGERECIAELARMIGGETISDAVLQSAEEMKKAAKK